MSDRLSDSSTSLIASPVTDEDRRRNDSDLLFSIAFQSNPNLMTITTLAEGRYLEINDACLKWIGGRRDEIVGKTVDEVQSWLFPEDRRLLVKRLESEGSVRDWEAQFRLPSGEVRTVLLAAERIRFHGQPCLLSVSTDITARKRIEESLRAGEERYKAFIAHSSEGIYRCEFDQPIPIHLPVEEQIERIGNFGYLAECNDTMARMYGFESAAEVIGKRIGELLPLSEEANRAYLRACIEGGYRISDAESQELAQDGSPKWFLNNLHCIIQDDQLVRVWGTQRDITARKHAEKSLWASEMRFAKAFLSSPVPMVIARLSDGQFLSVNESFLQLGGFSRNDVLGRSASELGLWSNPEERDYLLERLTQSGSFRDMEVEIRNRRGELRTALLSGEVIESEGMACAIIIGTDVTARRQAERERAEWLIRERQARAEAERERATLTAAIEQMNEGLMIHDHTATVVHANQRALQIYGFTLDDLCAHPANSLAEDRFADENGARLPIDRLPVQTAVREGHVITSRLWYTRPDGRQVLLEHLASPFFNESGELVGAITLTRDVTEREREHERAQQADKLRALGQLASGIAHNFNNVLAVIVGYTQLALPKVHDPDVEHYLRVVEQSAKDAANMVKRIQSFSHRSAAKEVNVCFSLFEVVRDAVDMTRPRWRNDAEALGIKYKVHLDWQADENLQVNGDPAALREVFLNIIFNALDAMPVGGQLFIVGTATATEARVRFTDTGSGMTEEIKKHLFEPFFTTKGVQGLGMGLSESYHIIEHHQGHIEVESRLYNGATFIVSLPLAHPAEPPQSVPRLPAVAAPIRSLVLDDEKFVRDVLAAILQQIGHVVTEAATVEDAYGLLEGTAFDVVFTDLAMPHTDGLAAAAAIKEKYPRTRVILMSGYSVEQAIDLAGSNPVFDTVISKPFNLAEIQTALSTVFGE